MTAASTRLIEFLKAIEPARLPAEVLAAARVSLLDNLGCGLFGAQKEWGRIVAATVLEEGSTGGATLYGSTRPMAPARAAFANGTATHGFELDDIIVGALAHPGAVIVPAALAAAEHVGASGQALVHGLVAGYEVVARLGHALGHAHNSLGFHTTGVVGPVGAAVAAGIIMKLDPGQLHSAVGIACSSAAGIKAFTQGTGGMVKRTHAGRAAESGVLACLLARQGFTGPQQAIDGSFGLMQVFGGNTVNTAAIDAGLGKHYAIARVWIKVYPCCGLIHSTLHAIETLRREHHIDGPAVRGITVYTGRRAVEQNGDPAPAEPMAAQYSIPYCAAVALTGNSRDPASYTPERLWQSDVREMMPRVRLEIDPAMEAIYPARFGARVRIETRDGGAAETTVLDAYGTPTDPVAPSDVEQKFRRMSSTVASASAIDDIVATVGRIERLTDIKSLSQGLRAASAVPTDVRTPAKAVAS